MFRRKFPMHSIPRATAPTTRATALTSFAAALSCAALIASLPTSLGFAARASVKRSSQHGGVDPALVDPALAKLGLIDERQMSSIDLLPGADLRWEFPRLSAAQLDLGESLTFVLPGNHLVDLPLVDRSLIGPDALSFIFADLDRNASAEITIHAGRVHGTVRAMRPLGRGQRGESQFESWSLRTETDQFGISGDFYSRSAAQGTVSVLKPDTAEAANDGGIAGAGCDDTGALIDVLIAYTDSFRAGYADLGSMKTAILADIAVANAGLANSFSVPRFRVVEYYDCTQNSNATIDADLMMLQNPVDGWNDAVHAARNDARADLVMLYSTSTPGGGAAFQGIEYGESGGFSVNCAPDSFVAAQLLGLNMGACFEPELAAACSGYFPYSHGYAFTVDGVNLGTIMVQSAPYLSPLYSNIYATVNGQPTGSDSQNNARTMSLTAQSVANFRCGNGPDPDCDNDGVLDTFAIANGLVPDCNGTGYPDSCDIAFGISVDSNGDGVPDECPLTDSEFWPNGVVQLDTFGTSVSLSSKAADPTILLGVGSPGDDTGASNAGSIFVLTATAGDLDLAGAHQLHASDPQANAYMGRSVSVFKRPSSVTPNVPARNLALAGAFRWPQITTSGNFTSKGAIYLFEELPTGDWAQVMMPATGGSPAQPWRYTPPATGGIGAQSYALFGYCAAMGHNPVENSEIIVVGAPGRDGGRGAVYVVRNPSLNVGSIRRDQPAAGVPKTITDASEGDNFGYAVALEDRIPTSGSARVAYIAGAPGTASSRGAAYLYERVASTNGYGTTWPTTVGYAFNLNSPVGLGAPLSEGDRYGTSVAICERLAVVGAPGAGEGKGRIYFWERNASTGANGRWNFRGYMSANDASVRGFGSSVAVTLSPSGDYTVVVGVALENVTVSGQVKTHAGAAHIIHKVFGQMFGTEVGVRTSNSPASGDEFGYSTTAIPGFSLIGEPFKDNGGLNAGAAKLLTIP